MTIADPNTVINELLSLEASSRVSSCGVIDSLKSVYQNGYYTNHGPLAQEFESQLEDYLEVRNVVTVGNESLALLIAALGIEPGGQVLAPRFGGHVVSQMATWLGLELSYCDINTDTGHPTLDDVVNAVTPNIKTIFLIDSWGHRVSESLVEQLVDLDFSIVLIAFESFGATHKTQSVSTNDRVATVFSFGPESLLETLQGGAIATNNDDWAARFRNTRSSYGARHKVSVKATCNGRFSELQAGLGIRSLAALDHTISKCKAIHLAMEEALRGDERIESIFKQAEGRRNYSRLPVLLSQKCARAASATVSEKRGRWPNSAKLTDRVLNFPVSKFNNVQHGVQFANRYLEFHSH